MTATTVMDQRRKQFWVFGRILASSRQQAQRNHKGQRNPRAAAPVALCRSFAVEIPSIAGGFPERADGRKVHDWFIVRAPPNYMDFFKMFDYYETS